MMDVSMSEHSSMFDGLLVAKGANIFQAGDAGECAYFVERGQVEISIQRGAEKVVLARRGAGEIFGEMAIIDNKPRTATVTAASNCELLLITREQLNRRIEESDPILRMLLTVLMERFRSTMDQLQGVNLGDAPLNSLTAIDDEREHVAIQEIRLERELEQAIEHQDFELHFQPIVDLRDTAIAGFESLVRWRHKTRGLISPMVFIPTAEASGLIVPLGRLCLEQACTGFMEFEGLRRPEDHVRDDMFVSVNVSGRDFDDRNFVSNIMRTLLKTGADPRRLKLEITETMLMQQPERAAEALRECKIKGLSIAIDDFGAGYSSLGYLHKFPIDTLKIDRSFVMAMHDDDRSMKIIRSILSMAKELQIPVVAEGIETKRDADCLRDLGCEYGQGYYFARPMPRADAAGLLGAWGKTIGVEAQKQAV